MSDEVYFRLSEFLDRMPGGFPRTHTGVEIKILKKLLTPEEAEIVQKLRFRPESVATIARRVGMDEASAAGKLEKMAREGNIYRVKLRDTVRYMATQFIVGIYEFHLNSIDRELAGLMEEYLPYLGDSLHSVKTKQLRVVPVQSSLQAVPAVAGYNKIRELIEQQQTIAVAPCICRKEKGLLGQPCQRPQQTCFTFSYAAQYYVENGMGRYISVKEALEILDLAEQQALVLSPTNAEQITAICCCCGCCCGLMQMLKTLERPAQYVQSNYRAAIDAELCNNCGSCRERCQIEALVDDDEITAVDEGRCIGCGLCVSACPEDAITMVEREPLLKELPKNLADMLSKIAKERGLAG